MSVLTVRGGVPVVKRHTATNAGVAADSRVVFPFYLLYLKARNTGGAEVVRMYFTENDFTNDENYVVLPVPTTILPYGEWEGPVETVQTSSEPDRSDVWLRSESATPSVVEVVGFQRRG